MTITQQFLTRFAPNRKVLEVGGGSGGDLATWVHNGCSFVEVLEPDPVSCAEYIRRLKDSYHATTHVDGVGALYFRVIGPQTSSASLFHVAHKSLYEWSPWCSHDVAVLHFSISQIVHSDDDAKRLFRFILKSIHQHHFLLSVCFGECSCLVTFRRC